VHRALEALPERERTLIELAYWSGLSQSELASVLNLPLGTVKTCKRGALTALPAHSNEKVYARPLRGDGRSGNTPVPAHAAVASFSNAISSRATLHASTRRADATDSRPAAPPTQ
jgi:hypothetical protein